MKFVFQNDEILLAMVSLIREVAPRMIQQGPEGFTVDFDALARNPAPTPDQALLLEFQKTLSAAADLPGGIYEMELTAAHGRRLADALDHLARLQDWAADVHQLCDGLRARLLAIPSEN